MSMRSSGRKSSPIWAHFTVLDETFAECNICKNKFSYKTSITNLKTHFYARHPKYKIRLNETVAPPTLNCSNMSMISDHKKPNPIWDYFTALDDCFGECNICKNVFSYKRSVTDLRRHLNMRHPNIKIDLNRMVLSSIDDDNSVDSSNMSSISNDTTSSSVWHHFTPLADFFAECNACKNTFSYKTSVSNLKKHLQTIHPTFQINVIGTVPPLTDYDDGNSLNYPEEMAGDNEREYFLKWSDYGNKITDGFYDILNDKELVDCTLVVDGKLIQAHKLILSSCSSVFRNMFKIIGNQPAFVVLNDVPTNSIHDLLTFMYTGEVNVKEDELSAFLSVANNLKIKGLTDQPVLPQENVQSTKKPISQPTLMPKRKFVKLPESVTVPKKAKTITDPLNDNYGVKESKSSGEFCSINLPDVQSTDEYDDETTRDQFESNVKIETMEDSFNEPGASSSQYLPEFGDIADVLIGSVTTVDLKKPESETGQSTRLDTFWSVKETQWLLDRYHKYLPVVGLDNRFRQKKHMWIQMSKEITAELGVVRTPQQISNRYKTVVRTKRNQQDQEQKKAPPSNVSASFNLPPDTYMSTNCDFPDQEENTMDAVIKTVKEETLTDVVRNLAHAICDVILETNRKREIYLKQRDRERESNTDRRHRELLGMLSKLHN